MRILVIPVLSMTLIALSGLTGGQATSANEPLLCQGQVATLVADELAPATYGTGGADVIVGLGEETAIYGLGGDDTNCHLGARGFAYGGAGNDSVEATIAFGDSGRDVVRGIVADGGSGDDLVVAVAKAVGGAGNDHLSAIDFCNGGSGSDTADGCLTRVNIP